jgi:hypothetical protein
MRTEDTETSIFGRYDRAAALALVFLIIAKLAFVFVFTWHTRFVMDEFGQIGFAKYLGHGLFETVAPTKAVGFAVFYKLAHLLGGHAVSILRIGRIQTALLACATLSLVYACARALGETRLRALTIILVLLCFSNFAERIFRTRSEPLEVFFAAAALLVTLRGRGLTASRIVAAGVLSGLSFLTSQKAVYFDVALGLALIGDAALARRYADGVARGAWLVFGWLLPVILYCFAFGHSHPIAIAQTLVYGPMEVATEGSSDWGGLRGYVLQTLVRNTLLYLFCFAGMAISLARIRTLDQKRRVALIFSLIITILVFLHYQPWPYVFVMALPFLSLWALVPIDRYIPNSRDLRIAWALLAIALIGSFVRNVQYLQYGNEQQLDVVKRAEALTGPRDVYFDGVGMLPNRQEPSTLWLDAHYVHKTLREGARSEAYRIFTRSPPKTVIWSYRMDGVEPVVGPRIQASYVHVAPNILIAGRHLWRGQSQDFRTPVNGAYRLYDTRGNPVPGTVEVDGKAFAAPFDLTIGAHKVTLRDGPSYALLLPAGSYSGKLLAAGDYPDLFADVYN